MWRSSTRPDGRDVGIRASAPICSSSYEFPMDMDDIDGQVQALALTVLKCRTGFLLAVPQGAFSDSALAAGLIAPPEEMVGQSVTISVQAGLKSSMEDAAPPAHEDGASVEVVLVDVSDSMGRFLSPFDAAVHSLDAVLAFTMERPLLMPMPDDLIGAAWEWVVDPSSGERVVFYSATEEEDVVPETPPRGFSPDAAPLPSRRASTMPRGAQPKVNEPEDRRNPDLLWLPWRRA